MTPLEISAMFESYNQSCWIIDNAIQLPDTIQEHTFIALKCKTCDFRKEYLLKNIRYMLMKKASHIKCQKCDLQHRRKEKSNQLLSTLDKIISGIQHFPWLVNKAEIEKTKIYNCKSQIPLLCRHCNTSIYHSYSNIQTCQKRPNHITCQECKVRAGRKERLSRNTDEEYIMSTDEYLDGYKITHSNCGNYFYMKTGHLNRKLICPFCSEDKWALQKLKTQQLIEIFFNKKSTGKLSFHSFDFTKKIFHVSCIDHPEYGIYTLGWNAFLRCRNKKGAYSCRLCQNQRLRRTSFSVYKNRLDTLGLKIKDIHKEEKIDKKKKYYIIVPKLITILLF